jgi:hypothetical protein
MPIYEYQCLKTGEIFGLLQPVKNAGISKVPCYLHCEWSEDRDGSLVETNFHDAERIFSTFNTLSDTPSTVYFKNPKTGEVQLGSNKYDTSPNGYVKEEAKGLAGRLQLEKQLQKQDRDKSVGAYNNELLNKSLLTKQRHDEIKANLNTVHTIKHEDGKEEKFTLDDQTKDLMKLAMERSNKTKPRYKERPFIFPVNHNDKSNRSKE